MGSKKVDLKLLASCVGGEIIGNVEKVGISSVVCDSRKVTKGAMFCCVSGTFMDGHKYAPEAIEKGAVAILCERELEVNVPQIKVPNVRQAMAVIAAEFYGHPAEDMTIIGVTGTNGKTSTTYMLKSIFEAEGKKVGVIGTICVMIGDKAISSERTTPDSIQLQSILNDMRNEGVDVVVMEVSSHALDQYRVHGILFDVAIFTNLTPEHLDYHNTMEEYLAAKKKLFYMSVNAVINSDDSYAGSISEGLKCPIKTFGTDKNADVCARDINCTVEKTSYTLCLGKETHEITVHIPGRFTVYNSLGAATAAMLLGVSWEHIIEGLGAIQGVAGRLQALPTGDKKFHIMLDYAHTPDALENVISTVRDFAPGRVVTVFGCGGDRDHVKRPVMGEIASRLSDFIVVTSDNPRTEEPMSIINDIMAGVKKDECEYVIIENRREAIKYAMENAKDDDIIILAGKGHEDYQEINGEKHHFDEKEVVAEILAEMK